MLFFQSSSYQYYEVYLAEESVVVFTVHLDPGHSDSRLPDPFRYPAPEDAVQEYERIGHS
jgi:hypothetical protein